MILKGEILFLLPPSTTALSLSLFPQGWQRKFNWYTEALRPAKELLDSVLGLGVIPAHEVAHGENHRFHLNTHSAPIKYKARFFRG